MRCCESWHPLLSRAAEAEIGPQEALRLAKHLADCTPCRILLARERRLAEMLEHELEDRLPLGEEFVGTVMARLPRIRRSRSQLQLQLRRRLKLAALAAIGLLPALSATRELHTVASAIRPPSLPLVDLERGWDVLSVFFGVARATVLGLETISGAVPVVAASLPAVGAIAVLAVAIVPVLAFAAALCALGARGASMLGVR